jgi:hypothetical protein
MFRMQYYFIHVLYIWSYDYCKVHTELSNMEEQPAEGLDKLDYTIKYDVSLADWTRIRLSLEVLPSRRPISKRRLPDLLFAT